MENLLHRRLTRREALKYGLGAVSLGAAYVAGLDTTPSTLPEKVHLPGWYIKTAEKFKDPIYRAATAIIWGTEKGTKIDRRTKKEKEIDIDVTGFGGIFRIGNDLCLLTDHHVVDTFEGKPRFWVPGLTGLDLRLENDWEYFGLPGEDPNVSYKLAGETANVLESAAGAGVINPLTFYEGTFNSRDVFAIPMPDIGQKAYLRYKKFHPKTNEIEFDMRSGYTCDGFSGLPTLFVDQDNRLTNQSVGLLSAAMDDDKLISPSRVCRNDEHFIVPHLKVST